MNLLVGKGLEDWLGWSITLELRTEATKPIAKQLLKKDSAFTKIHYIFVGKTIIVVYNNGMKEKKYFIDTVIEKEKQRNENMRLAYEKRILDLPRGSLVIRELKGRKYCYLRYREGKKVVQKYAGTIEQEEIIRAKIAERKHLVALVAMLEEESKRIMKMEAVK